MDIEIIRTEDRVDAGDKPFGCKPAIAESGNVVGDGIETVGNAGNIGEPAGGHPGGKGCSTALKGIRLIRQLLRDLIDGIDEAINEGKPTCGALRQGKITEPFEQLVDVSGDCKAGSSNVIPNCRCQLDQSCFAQIEGDASLQIQAASQSCDGTEGRFGESTQAFTKELLNNVYKGYLSIPGGLRIGKRRDDRNGFILRIDDFNCFFREAIAVVISLLYLILDIGECRLYRFFRWKQGRTNATSNPEKSSDFIFGKLIIV